MDDNSPDLGPLDTPKREVEQEGGERNRDRDVQQPVLEKTFRFGAAVVSGVIARQQPTSFLFGFALPVWEDFQTLLVYGMSQSWTLPHFCQDEFKLKF